MEETQAIVLDLNVLLAAILKPEGYTAAMLLRLYIEKHVLYVPDYVKEEFQEVIGEMARRKGIKEETLKTAFKNILKLTRQIEIKNYEEYLKEAEYYVRDPKDTPYVALALYLRRKHRQAIILTYNKKDYKHEELEKKDITTLTPRELQETKI